VCHGRTGPGLSLKEEPGSYEEQPRGPRWRYSRSHWGQSRADASGAFGFEGETPDVQLGGYPPRIEALETEIEARARPTEARASGRRSATRSYLLVIDSLTCGGAERHVAELSAELCNRGHSVTVACSQGGHFAAEAERGGARVEILRRRLVKRRFSAAFAMGIRRLLDREQFDLIHAHLYASSAAAAAASLGRSIPLVVTEQTQAPWRNSAQRKASALVYRRATRVIGVSRAITEELAVDFGVPREKVAYIPNGVNPQTVDGSARPDRRGPVVGLIARLVPEKDVRSFLRCARQLIATYPEATFPIAGDGPLRDELAGFATELGIDDRVDFLGVQEDMEGFLSQLDVLAVSSVAEGTPLSIAEAMRAGVPIVATAVGGIPDQIEDGVHGLLVAPREPRALATGITDLLENPAKARKLAEAARDRAISNFSVEAVADRVEAQYAGALAGAAVPSRREIPAW
jgi:glycosyltransferase involved in cell wall biosynthesis